jgi:hypothetical protein
MLCNNWDRLPVIWDNEGNLRNIRVEHIGVDEPNIVALDNTITCIIPDNFNTYEEKLRDCLAALTTDVNSEYKGYKTVREVLSFTSSVDFTEKEIREVRIEIVHRPRLRVINIGLDANRHIRRHHRDCKTNARNANKNERRYVPIMQFDFIPS